VTEEGATSSAALEHGDLMAQRDRVQRQRGAGLGSLRASGSAALVDIAVRAGYRQPIGTTSELARTEF